jgi:hypothetical protein
VQPEEQIIHLNDPDHARIVTFCHKFAADHDCQIEKQQDRGNTNLLVMKHGQPTYVADQVLKAPTFEKLYDLLVLMDNLRLQKVHTYERTASSSRTVDVWSWRWIR